MPASFFDSVLALIIRTSTDLPPDVRAAMKVAMATETPGTQSAQALSIIAQNIDLAADCEGAICQDTGMPTFEVKTPVGVNQIVLKKQIKEAVAEATKRGKLIRRVNLPVNQRPPLQDELAAFIQAVQHHRRPPVTGSDGRAALALALRIEQAMRHQRIRNAEFGMRNRKTVTPHSALRTPH